MTTVQINDIKTLAAVATAASKDEGRLLLTVVRVEYDQARDFRDATATDSYRLATAPIDELRWGKNPPTSFAAHIPAKFIAAIRKITRAEVTLTIDVDDAGKGTVSADLSSQTGMSGLKVQTELIDGDYVNWRGLVPTRDDVNADGVLAWLNVENAIEAGKFFKALSSRRSAYGTPTVTAICGGKLKPYVFVASYGAKYLIVPVRVADEDDKAAAA